jgi:hypothetical protein
MSIPQADPGTPHCSRCGEEYPAPPPPKCDRCGGTHFERLNTDFDGDMYRYMRIRDSYARKKQREKFAYVCRINRVRLLPTPAEGAFLVAHATEDRAFYAWPSSEKYREKGTKKVAVYHGVRWFLQRVCGYTLKPYVR